jgi:hypothetical protein
MRSSVSPSRWQVVPLKILVDHFGAQADDLENLRAAVGIDRADAIFDMILSICSAAWIKGPRRWRPSVAAPSAGGEAVRFTAAPQPMSTAK